MSSNIGVGVCCVAAMDNASRTLGCCRTLGYGLLVILWFCGFGVHRGTALHNDFVTRAYNNYSHKEGLDHWENYGYHYSQHLHSLRNLETINMLEIGVSAGGSSRLWYDVFGAALRYTGVDINPACAQFTDAALNIEIIIGSQLNKTFLGVICQNYGPFDVVIDDGGHTSQMIITSFEILWPCMRNSGIYVIEDLHSMWMWKGNEDMTVDGQDVYGFFGDMGRESTSHLSHNLHYTGHHPLGKHIASMHFYDSMIFLHYQEAWTDLKRFQKGEKFLT